MTTTPAWLQGPALERSQLPQLIQELRDALIHYPTTAAGFIQDVTLQHQAAYSAGDVTAKDLIQRTIKTLDAPDSIAIFYVTASTMDVLDHLGTQMSADDFKEVIETVCDQPHLTAKPTLVLSERPLPYAIAQGQPLGLPNGTPDETEALTQLAHGILIPHISADPEILQAYLISPQGTIRKTTRYQRKLRLLVLVATLLHFQSQGSLITPSDKTVTLTDPSTQTSKRSADTAATPVRFLDLRKVRTANSQEVREAQKKQRRYGTSHRFMVSGHLRKQPYGPGRSKTRLIYIEPYIKGADGTPLIIRPDVKIL